MYYELAYLWHSLDGMRKTTKALAGTAINLTI